jgi:hypothetical protein
MPPRIKFDELITIDDWSGALRRILEAAVKATEAKDALGRQDLMDLLLTFIKLSPAQVEVLDMIAREAIQDLSLAEISASLERMTSSRIAEVNRSIGLIDAVTAESKRDARALQLESTLDALRKARAAVEALNRIEKALSHPDTNLLDKLKATGEAISAATQAISPQEADAA